MGFVSLKNVEHPMELMRVRVDWSPESASEALRETGAREAPAVVVPDDATMRA
jgi:hypothetical protein